LCDAVGKPLLLTISPDNVLTFRVKGSREAVQVELDTVYRIACGTGTVGYTNDEIHVLRGLESKIMINPEFAPADAFKCVQTIREEIRRKQQSVKEDEEESAEDSVKRRRRAKC
jgi:hypothetical protein